MPVYVSRCLGIVQPHHWANNYAQNIKPINYQSVAKKCSLFDISASLTQNNDMLLVLGNTSFSRSTVTGNRLFVDALTNVLRPEVIEDNSNEIYYLLLLIRMQTLELSILAFFLSRRWWFSTSICFFFSPSSLQHFLIILHLRLIDWPILMQN